MDPDGRFLWLLAAAAIVIAFDEYANTPTYEGDVYEKTSGERFLDGVEAVGYVTSAAAGRQLLQSAAARLKCVSTRSSGTELVQRAMSKAELKATQETGLVRGGREGTHYVSDAVNKNANRARQRLALRDKPEVKATLEVKKGTFSEPSKVQPKNNMRGGGTERTGTGEVKAKVVKVKELD